MAGPLYAQERPSERLGQRHKCSVKVVACPRFEPAHGAPKAHAPVNAASSACMSAPAARSLPNREGRATVGRAGIVVVGALKRERIRASFCTRSRTPVVRACSDAPRDLARSRGMLAYAPTTATWQPSHARVQTRWRHAYAARGSQLLLVAITQDPAGNLKPAKDKSTGRIDGIVALIMAIGRALVVQEEPQPSVPNVLLPTGWLLNPQASSDCRGVQAWTAPATRSAFQAQGSRLQPVTQAAEVDRGRHVLQVRLGETAVAAAAQAEGVSVTQRSLGCGGNCSIFCIVPASIMSSVH